MWDLLQYIPIWAGGRVGKDETILALNRSWLKLDHRYMGVPCTLLLSICLKFSSKKFPHLMLFTLSTDKIIIAETYLICLVYTYTKELLWSLQYPSWAVGKFCWWGNRKRQRSMEALTWREDVSVSQEFCSSSSAGSLLSPHLFSPHGGKQPLPKSLGITTVKRTHPWWLSAEAAIFLILAFPSFLSPDFFIAPFSLLIFLSLYLPTAPQAGQWFQCPMSSGLTSGDPLMSEGLASESSHTGGLCPSSQPY